MDSESQQIKERTPRISPGYSRTKPLSAGGREISRVEPLIRPHYYYQRAMIYSYLFDDFGCVFSLRTSGAMSGLPIVDRARQTR